MIDNNLSVKALVYQLDIFFNKYGREHTTPCLYFSNSPIYLYAVVLLIPHSRTKGPLA